MGKWNFEGYDYNDCIESRGWCFEALSINALLLKDESANNTYSKPLKHPLLTEKICFLSMAKFCPWV